MSTPVSLVSAIEKAVSERSLLKHPFYQAWSAGALTRQQLAGYAKEYYWVARNVPGIMNEIEKRVPASLAAGTKKILAEQASEEREHVELWERFARSLGITKKQLRSYRPTTTVRNAVSNITKTARKGFEEGIAAMYAFESELPAISSTKSEGLIKFYGLRSKDAHVYFKEHIKEEKHLRLWRRFLRNVAPARRRAALAAARTAVAAQNQVLDGVMKRYCTGMMR
ncbi:hypothetical protein A3H16_00025 [Candidatus Kaiserbacteria bacterium RIFCSPLOWO2_12_FULL_53_8]|uniref:Thiaminase-2/PQQC domain-containing protein n=2 Tax=Candidatus Kaiseribacteriota TaxID=1752734 RepID=A0A1F6CVF5_9BACT|nr:MAG: hypothetical protein A2851_03655 [Candidatus Kaiserbacteria bacterium RIFCSPHIGHO2_01_FULL_53_29]OGG91348.1 MAG: hypothetical protein A3H16_00025 [Candidatus Kaiserbacteria bacterium RIFCSPLOWO2_12_FULL_53_8]